MRDLQPHAVRQHPGQAGEGSGLERLLAPVAPGQRVRALDRPVHVVGDVGKECLAVSGLEPEEDLPDVIGRQWHVAAPLE